MPTITLSSQYIVNVLLLTHCFNRNSCQT